MMKLNDTHRKHYVAVIGGSISGSEAASVLSKNGFRVVVFEMNALPYGKIEDGLPSWHIKLRDRQQREIDKKLDQENIRYVPHVKIGETMSFQDLIDNWGFTAIILANGAWKDRGLPIEGVEKFRDNGLIYQNDFIYWFNHKHEPDYKGRQYQIRDNAVVVGGGLASLDVVKIFMIELVSERLKSRFDIEVDIFTIEKSGVDAVLEKYGVDFNQLGIEGVTLVYRRTARDMPFKSPRDQSPESIEKAKNVSEHLLKTNLEKYKFRFKPLHMPSGIVEEDGALEGLILQKVEIKDGKVMPLDNETEVLKTDMVISSIGSLPEPIEGLNYEWGSLKMKEGDDYHVFGYDNVFAVGNAVTGRGNIQESKQHGRRITREIIDKHLTEDALEEWLTNLNTSIQESTSKQIHSIVQEISGKDIQPDDIIDSILRKTEGLNDLHGYSNYAEWVEKHKPVRLEDLLENRK
ncbi:MAG: FAD-dependent oxidoreductase [Bacteroidia bacterium]|nr:FAD-dependent oxidoreductase [Bacteroidia bacterium]